MNSVKQSGAYVRESTELLMRYEGCCRAVISGVSPEIEDGRFAIKRTVGEGVTVEADVFADGHDQLSAVLLYRHESLAAWAEAPMEALGNDRWRGTFQVSQLGGYRYTVLAWVDRFKSWQHDLSKKLKARQDAAVDLLAGAALVEAAGRRAVEGGATQLAAWAEVLAGHGNAPLATRLELALSPRLAELWRVILIGDWRPGSRKNCAWWWTRNWPVVARGTSCSRAR